MASFRKLLQEEGIADLGLVPMTLSQKGIGSVIQKRFRLASNTRWAVVNSKEECLTSGQAIPKANDFAQVLAAKGVQSPIRILREFIKTHPDHLEARMDLLRLQQKSAGQRTRAALGLELEDQTDDSGLGGTGVTGGTVFMMRTGSDGVINFQDRPKSKPIPAGKVLDNALDLQIWGGYAESFDRLLSSDDWIAGGLNFNSDDASLEVCSPLLKGLYKRKIAQVEAALERAPANSRLWSVWIRMADVIGNKSAQSVVDRLAQQPGSVFSSWPEEVRKRLIDEARANNRWNHVADYLWSSYEGTLRQNTSINMRSTLPNFNQNETLRRMFDSMWTEQWDNLFEPLLEALIRMNDLGRADTILNTLRERQQQGLWSETQMLKAIALANRCDRPDVAQLWSAYLTENNAVK
jgi:hypothetical protein